MNIIIKSFLTLIIITLIATVSYGADSYNNYTEVDYIVIEYKKGSPVCIYKQGKEPDLHAIGINTMISYGNDSKDRILIKEHKERFEIVIEQKGKIYDVIFVLKSCLPSYSPINKNNANQ